MCVHRAICFVDSSTVNICKEARRARFKNVLIHDVDDCMQSIDATHSVSTPECVNNNDAEKGDFAELIAPLLPFECTPAFLAERCLLRAELR